MTDFNYTDLCKQVELQAMAEDIAALGYQTPKFSWIMPCKYVALDVDTPTDTRNGDTPNVKRIVDFRAQIKAAWQVLLSTLEEQGIAIPDIARQPILPGIKDTCRNRVRPDGLEVNCWMVDLGKFNYVAQGGKEKLWRTADPIPYIKANAGNTTKGNVVSIKYAAVTPNEAYSAVEGITITTNSTIWIYDANVATSAELKAALQGVYAVVELADPLFIPFEQPVNLSLGELSKYTFIGAHDINDAPMYDLQTHYEYQDKHFLLTRWNKDWVAEHKEFPMCAITTFDGIGFVADYNAVYTDHFLLQDIVTQLKNKGIIS